jgi:alpha-1,2-mannosyltransferase
MAIDKEQYGKWVSPPWNILIYNTHAGGDELYGIEPLSYYVKNLALNFNYVAGLGVIALPLVVLLRRDIPSMLVILLPMYVWLGVVFPRPHKEERFLFPIYPGLCLGAALLSITLVDSTSRWFLKSAMPASSAFMIQVIVWSPAVLISLSRTLALSRYYTAPLQVYSQLQHQPDVAGSVLCTCGEWYRFPSSFYLPSTIRSFGFVASSFQGQLPQTFLQSGSGPNELHFNDQNRPEPGSYTLIEECDYLVDLLSSNDCRENDSIWKPIAMGAFLNADRTTSMLHRTLYLPFWHEREELRGSVEYNDYILYKRLEEE